MKASCGSRKNFVAPLLLTLALLSSAADALPNPVQNGEKRRMYFGDEDLKVEKLSGKWRIQSMYDASQLSDPPVPVHVKTISMYWGTGKYLGLAKVPEVTLENRGNRATRMVQLRWQIVSVNDPEVTLLEGFTPFFKAEIEPFSANRLDIPEIYFNKILKPLVKEGELNGHFRLILGVQEVRFSDHPVDVLGDGFALTDRTGGVEFDMDGNGARERLSWVAPGGDDSFLILDRDGDGRIDGGAELFGNFTPQPPPPVGEVRNGFLALAEFDRAAQGGNGDGLITASDGVFARLRLWQDADHDGVSRPGELRTLPSSGIQGLELRYKESKRTDEHGNQFRYRAKVLDARVARPGRWAWNVFLVSTR